MYNQNIQTTKYIRLNIYFISIGMKLIINQYL